MKPVFIQTQRMLLCVSKCQNGHHERSGSPTAMRNGRPKPTPVTGSLWIVAWMLKVSSSRYRFELASR